MRGLGAGVGRQARPRALVIVGAVLLVVALFLPWYRGVARPIECLAAPCPQPLRTFSAWEAFRFADLVLSGLAVLQVVLAVRLARGAPVMVCLLAIASAATIAFALANPTQPRVVSSLHMGFAVALFASGTSGLGGLLAQIELRHEDNRLTCGR